MNHCIIIVVNFVRVAYLEIFLPKTEGIVRLPAGGRTLHGEDGTEVRRTTLATVFDLGACLFDVRAGRAGGSTDGRSGPAARGPLLDLTPTATRGCGPVPAPGPSAGVNRGVLNLRLIKRTPRLSASPPRRLPVS